LELIFGFLLFPSQRITYAKSKSDVISQRDGSFVARPKRKADQSDNKPAAKQQKSDKASVSSAFQSTTQTIVDDEVPPHSVLFVQQLPVEASQQMVAALFSPYDGFKEVHCFLLISHFPHFFSCFFLVFLSFRLV
jgi:U2 small nuclear ribonucleoprotein B''